MDRVGILSEIAIKLLIQNVHLKRNLFDCFQMLYAIKDREDLENLNELASLQDQVKAVRLQDKIGKQKFHENLKKVFEPITKSLVNTSQDITK